MDARVQDCEKRGACRLFLFMRTGPLAYATGFPAYATGPRVRHRVPRMQRRPPPHAPQDLRHALQTPLLQIALLLEDCGRHALWTVYFLNAIPRLRG